MARAVSNVCQPTDMQVDDDANSSCSSPWSDNPLVVEYRNSIPELVSDVDQLLAAAAAGDKILVLQQLVQLQDAASNHDADGYTALQFAARNGHTDIVALLLQHGADVDAATHGDQDTALHLSTLHGFDDVVQQLLEAGADIDAQNIDGSTALHIAAEAGDLQLVQLLVGAEADVNVQDWGGETALILAAQQGHTEVVRKLLSAGAIAETAACSDGYRALHHAAMQGHLTITNLLLAKEAAESCCGLDDPRVKTGGKAPQPRLAAPVGQASTAGTQPAGAATDASTSTDSESSDSGSDEREDDCATPLQLAAQFNQPRVVTRLLSAAAAADHDDDSDTNSDTDMADALHAALASGSTACFDLLVAAGALQSGVDTSTLMYEAISRDDSAAVRQLLEAGVSPNEEAGGWIPLHLTGSKAVARQLLLAGADINAADRSGLTALHWAAGCVAPPNIAVLRLLLADAGVEVDARDTKGCTPLHHAAMPTVSKETAAARNTAVKLLLQAGAAAGATNKIAATPVHFAAQYVPQSVHHQCRGIICQLMAAGASVDAADSAGSTPLHDAVRSASADMVQLLLKLGASQLPDKDLNTPLHLAARSGRDCIVQLLLTAGAPVNAANDLGCTALDYAARSRHLSTVQQLLAANAQVSAHTLHEAAVGGCPAVVRLLLNTGRVDVHAVTGPSGATPLHHAAAGGYVDVVKLLLESGARADAMDSEQHTPLHLAAEEGHVAVARLLVAWAPPSAEVLRSAIVLASDAADTVDVVVYLLQQLAAVQPDAVQEVLEEVQDGFDDPSSVMFAMVSALHAATAGSDAAAAAQAAEARQLAESRRNVQHLITGLAAMHMQHHQQQQQQQVQGSLGQQQQEEQEQDVAMECDQRVGTPQISPQEGKGARMLDEGLSQGVQEVARNSKEVKLAVCFWLHCVGTGHSWPQRCSIWPS